MDLPTIRVAGVDGSPLVRDKSSAPLALLQDSVELSNACRAFYQSRVEAAAKLRETLDRRGSTCGADDDAVADVDPGDRHKKLPSADCRERTSPCRSSKIGSKHEGRLSRKDNAGSFDGIGCAGDQTCWPMDSGNASLSGTGVQRGPGGGLLVIAERGQLYNGDVNRSSRGYSKEISSLDTAIDVLRREMVSLMDLDLRLMKQLLTLNEAIEDLKWRRRRTWVDNCNSSQEGSSWDMMQSATSLSDKLEMHPALKFSTPSSLSLQLEGQDAPRFSVYDDEDNTNTFNRSQRRQYKFNPHRHYHHRQQHQNLTPVNVETNGPYGTPTSVNTDSKQTCGLSDPNKHANSSDVDRERCKKMTDRKGNVQPSRQFKHGRESVLELNNGGLLTTESGSFSASLIKLDSTSTLESSSNSEQGRCPNPSPTVTPSRLPKPSDDKSRAGTSCRDQVEGSNRERSSSTKTYKPPSKGTVANKRTSLPPSPGDTNSSTAQSTWQNTHTRGINLDATSSRTNPTNVAHKTPGKTMNNQWVILAKNSSMKTSKTVPDSGSAVASGHANRKKIKSKISLKPVPSGGVVRQPKKKPKGEDETSKGETESHDSGINDVFS